MNKVYLKKLTIGLRKSAPTVLSIVASGGVILTSVLVSKATKAASLKDVKDASTKSKMKAILPCYIPPIVSGAATIACIFGANILNKRTQAAMASAYALVNQAYKDYIRKNIELHGEKAHNDILEAIEIEKAKKINISADCLFECCHLTSEDDNEEKRLFHDAFSDRYFESTLSKVIEAEYHINRNFMLMGSVTVNDFYEFLGLESMKGGNDLAWDISEGLCWIEFDNRKITLEDGLECYLITMPFEPVPMEAL